MRKLFLTILISFFALTVYSQEVISEFSEETLSVLNEELRQKLDGIRKLLKDWDAGNYEIQSKTFESDVATGTAPLTVASTTVVTNLNADLWDGNSQGTLGTISSGVWQGTDIALGYGGIGSKKIDSGTVAASASSDFTITFNFTFGAAPVVILTLVLNNTDSAESPRVKTTSTTGAVGHNRHSAGINVNWIAFGAE